MELKYLRTFKTIIDEGSFQNAAERLNFSQSTVTFQIQQLEQSLSVKLFERIGRKMAVTQAGKEILPHIDAILDEVASIERYGKDVRDLGGELTVSMPETLLTYKSQRALKRFREEVPRVRLSLQMHNCFVIRDQILSGAVDCGFHYDVGGYNNSIHSEKIAEYEIALVCSPELRERDFITKHRRKDVSLITAERDNVYYIMCSRYLSERDIVLNGVLELGSVEAIKRSVASNIGIAALPRFTVEDELAKGELHEIETKMRDRRISVLCAFHKNKWMSPAMERFILLMKDTL
ncbi:LysR family transcriptional regulator [Cloacibacillus porcorum]|jgi:DNA-binding transcriptional LysR family regulator|uniref:LysR family transcriptional regulator n=1 Tax=Cloacibacillus porcorum TaxID=1197717 RepID=A0A1B2I8S2_9BACT|nr:LysR family transcriptional regulator [Cloacibacillus porcorum]ANZ46394.1 LysR family transcriptional regulator [Cloacibacillus porcorum]